MPAGSDDWIDDDSEAIARLTDVRDRTLREILDHDEAEEPESMRGAARVAGLEARYWRTCSLLYERAGDTRSALDAASRALKFEEQLARAEKAKLADRVRELEDLNAARLSKSRSLRALKAV